MNWILSPFSAAMAWAKKELLGLDECPEVGQGGRYAPSELRAAIKTWTRTTKTTTRKGRQTIGGGDDGDEREFKMRVRPLSSFSWLCIPGFGEKFAKTTLKEHLEETAFTIRVVNCVAHLRRLPDLHKSSQPATV